MSAISRTRRALRLFLPHLGLPPLLSTAYTPPGSRGGPHLEDDTDVLAQWVHVLEGELEGNGVGVEVGTVLPPSRG